MPKSGIKANVDFVSLNKKNMYVSKKQIFPVRGVRIVVFESARIHKKCEGRLYRKRMQSCKGGLRNAECAASSSQ